MARAKRAAVAPRTGQKATKTPSRTRFTQDEQINDLKRERLRLKQRIQKATSDARLSEQLAQSARQRLTTWQEMIALVTTRGRSAVGLPSDGDEVWPLSELSRTVELLISKMRDQAAARAAAVADLTQYRAAVAELAQYRAFIERLIFSLTTGLEQDEEAIAKLSASELLAQAEQRAFSLVEMSLVAEMNAGAQASPEPHNTTITDGLRVIKTQPIDDFSDLSPSRIAKRLDELPGSRVIFSLIGRGVAKDQ